jgi:hypothetical protein
MSIDVQTWWTGLALVSLVNVLLWLRAAQLLRRERSQVTAAVYAERQRHLWLSAVYVVVCGFRGLLPRADVQRICLVDSFFSSVLVGRTVATVAELCFALQWSLFVRQLADSTRTESARIIARVLVPLIIGAEISSWVAVLTTNFLGNVIEQSTWTLCGLLIATAYLRCWPRADAELRRYLRLTAIVIGCFVWFMSTVDVPHYLARWHHDELAGKLYLHWREGLRDAGQRWIVEYAWAPWRDEVAWMSLYFSVGVWVSISFTRAPARAKQPLAAAAPAAASTRSLAG